MARDLCPVCAMIARSLRPARAVRPGRAVAPLPPRAVDRCVAAVATGAPYSGAVAIRSRMRAVGASTFDSCLRAAFESAAPRAAGRPAARGPAADGTSSTYWPIPAVGGSDVGGVGLGSSACARPDNTSEQHPAASNVTVLRGRAP